MNENLYTNEEWIYFLNRYETVMYTSFGHYQIFLVLANYNF